MTMVLINLGFRSWGCGAGSAMIVSLIFHFEAWCHKIYFQCHRNCSLHFSGAEIGTCPFFLGAAKIFLGAACGSWCRVWS